MKQLLLYERVVPIQASVHGMTSVQTRSGFGFASQINSVPVVAAEIAAASRDMVVVFAGNNEAVFPAALMGVEESQNLYVDDQGAWTGRYIPAFLRRYPFVFAQSDDSDQLSLCIDESYDGVNQDGLGERLFDAAGERSGYLGQMLDFAAQYQVQFARTKLFCERLVRLSLLEPAVITLRDPEGATRQMSGFFRINRERLKSIPREELEQMFDTDELELCFLHLQSMANVETLSRKRADATPDARVMQ